MELVAQQFINGLSLGSIYALIALGYTMVYGIIELINFAHGDVCTLGTFFALAILSALGVTGVLHGPALIAVVVVAIAGAMLLCGLVGRPDRARRLPAAAQRAAARAADHRDRRLVHPRERACSSGADRRRSRFPQLIPDAVVHVGGVAIATQADRRRRLRARHDGRAAVLRLPDVARQGDARDGAGPRGRAVDGHRRQPHDRADVPDRQRARRRGRASSAARTTGRPGFFNGFSAGLKAFTAAVLGGIGNLAGAMLGGFLIGLIESFTTQFISDQWSNVVVFAVLILVLVVRPKGLLGESLPDKV